MILSTLGLSSHGFVFVLLPKKASYQLDIIHAYILISLPILADVRHYRTLGEHPAILLSNKVPPSLPLNQDFLHCIRAHHFVWLPPIRFLNLTLIQLVEKPHRPFHIHIDIIMSTLSLNPHGFVFGLLPQKALYQLDVIHAYILISILIFS